MQLPRTSPYRRRLVNSELRRPPICVVQPRLSVIVVSWGVVAMSFATMRTPAHFYALRLLLGVAEAGSFPGMWSVPCSIVRPGLVSGCTFQAWLVTHSNKHFTCRWQCVTVRNQHHAKQPCAWKGLKRGHISVRSSLQAQQSCLDVGRLPRIEQGCGMM